VNKSYRVLRTISILLAVIRAVEIAEVAAAAEAFLAVTLSLGKELLTVCTFYVNLIHLALEEIPLRWLSALLALTVSKLYRKDTSKEWQLKYLGGWLRLPDFVQCGAIQAIPSPSPQVAPVIVTRLAGPALLLLRGRVVDEAELIAIAFFFIITGRYYNRKKFGEQ
jgi:hypothetical protein